MTNQEISDFTKNATPDKARDFNDEAESRGLDIRIYLKGGPGTTDGASVLAEYEDKSEEDKESIVDNGQGTLSGAGGKRPCWMTS